ncbi:MAG: STAS domain-containing protein [Jatrophihabitantaceae bacterium]
MDLTIAERIEAGHTVIAVSGEVDLHSAPQLRDRLNAALAERGAAVVLDLSEVGFLDSTGLGVLVAARAAANDGGGAIPLVCTQDRILKLFTITGLDDVFDVHPSVADALAGLPD